MRSTLLLNISTVAVGAIRGAEIVHLDRVADEHTPSGLRVRGLSRGSWRKKPGHLEPFAEPTVDMSDYEEDRNEEVVPTVREEGQKYSTATSTDRLRRGKGKGPLKKDLAKVEPRVKDERSSSSMTAPTSSAFSHVTDTSITAVHLGDSSPVTSTSASMTTTTEEASTASATTAPTEQTIHDIFVWSTQATSTPETASVVLCPPHYNTSTQYELGDSIEANSRIYLCKSNPFYCNMHEMDDRWNDTAKELWRDAWVLVGDCEQGVEAREQGVTATEAPMAIIEEATETIDTKNITMWPTEAPMSTATTLVPPCPADYDMAKVTYIAGEYATVHSRIFQCSEKAGYARYCNIPVWQEVLLEENAHAYEMWAQVWEEVGPCLPTQKELMEAKVAADDWESR